MFAFATTLISLFTLPASAQTTWTIDQFISNLKNNQYQSIDEALQSLPVDVRSSFTLLYKGHGLRGTSYDKPGVILFSNQGDYAITFGDASLKLGNEIEIAKVDQTTSTVELYSAVFSSEHRHATTTVEKNPPICLTCHQPDPMLRWGEYQYDEYAKPFWPGVYGSMDDVIAEPGSQPKQPADWQPYLEYPHFISFMSQMKNLDRYRALNPIVGVIVDQSDDHSPVSPYTAIDKDHRKELRPNDRLTEVVSHIDAKRVARLIRSSPLYEKYKFWLLHRMLNCNLPVDNSPAFTKLQMDLTTDILANTYFTPLTRKRLSQLPTSVETILGILGVSYQDLQPNILNVVVTGKYPTYYEGTGDPVEGGTDASRALGFNSVAYFVQNFVYLDLLAARPNDSVLRKWYFALSNFEHDKAYFMYYSESLAFEKGVDKLAVRFDLENAANTCDDLYLQALTP